MHHFGTGKNLTNTCFIIQVGGLVLKCSEEENWWTLSLQKKLDSPTFASFYITCTLLMLWDLWKWSLWLCDTVKDFFLCLQVITKNPHTRFPSCRMKHSWSVLQQSPEHSVFFRRAAQSRAATVKRCSYTTKLPGVCDSVCGCVCKWSPRMSA